MGAAQRQNEIVKLLCQRRSEKICNLAFEFGVSERTIRRDLVEISRSEPIYTKRGKDGGIFVMPHYSLNRMYMSDAEISILNRILVFLLSQIVCVLNEEELIIYKNIIKNYTKPTMMKGSLR